MNNNKYVTILLNDIIFNINDHLIEYVFIRNYENYPSDIGGDIDIIINPKYIKKFDEIVKKICNQNSWNCMLYTVNNRMISYQLYKTDLTEEFRNIIVIEAFKGFNLVGFEYIKFSDIYQFKSIYKNMITLPYPYGMIISIIHYISRAGFYPEKYYKKVKNILNVDIKKVEIFLGFMFNNFIINKIIYFLKIQTNNSFKKYTNIPENISKIPISLRLLICFKLIIKAFKLNFIKSIKITILFPIEIFRRIINPVGRIILIKKINKENLLNKIKGYHLFKNSATIALNYADINYFNILKCVFNGGAAIILIQKEQANYNKFLLLSLLFQKKKIINLTDLNENNINKLVNIIINKYE